MDNFINRMDRRTLSIISKALRILIITAIAALAICLISGILNKIAEISFLKDITSFSILIFLISLLLLLFICFVLLIFFLIAAFKRDGMKKLIIKLFKDFYPSFILLLIVLFFKNKKLDWQYAFVSSAVLSLAQFLRVELVSLKNELKQENAGLNK